MCAPSPPPAPDYTGAAKAQGSANIEAAKVQGKINNPNVVSPYGTQTVTWNGDTPTLTQAFSPEQQAIYDTGNQTKIALSGLANQGASTAGSVIGKNVDLGGLPTSPGSATATRDKVFNAMMGRVNEDTAVSKDDLNSNLIASGIRPGTEAYDNQMRLIDRKHNDARQQALLAGGQEASRDFGLDTQKRKDALAEYLTQRQVPLNEITALMSGSQVNNPFATPGYAQNANVGAAPVYGATQDQGIWDAGIYNQQAAQAGGLRSGLFSLGGSAVMGAGMVM